MAEKESSLFIQSDYNICSRLGIQCQKRRREGHGSAALGKQFEIPIGDLWSDCIQDIPAFSLKILPSLPSVPLATRQFAFVEVWWQLWSIAVLYVTYEILHFLVLMKQVGPALKFKKHLKYI